MFRPRHAGEDRWLPSPAVQRGMAWVVLWFAAIVVVVAVAFAVTPDGGSGATIDRAEDRARDRLQLDVLDEEAE